ncbi:MAG TPA: hypothetical protein P5523_06770 [Bacteroidales bacterium]|jgi:hypothetical protein|nr:hypothetical protein [Prolixibacteraceae bacterium]HRT84325.1 hypothetical protein [Bacteroidales bacterium]
MADSKNKTPIVVVQNTNKNINKAKSGCGCGGILSFIIALLIIGYAMEWIEENPELAVGIGILLISVAGWLIYHFLFKKKR